MIDTERAVERLTLAHTEHTEAGPVEWPPLLAWLETRVTEIVGRKGGSGQGAGVPLNTEALELLTYIDRQLKLMCEAIYLPMTGDRVADTRMLWTKLVDGRTHDEIDDTQWERMTSELEDWVLRIGAEDDRPRKQELTVPCPRCETRWVMDEEGTKSAAVVIEFSEGRAAVAECRNPECGAIWAGWSQVARLGLTIGAQQDELVLAACGIDIPKIMIGE